MNASTLTLGEILPSKLKSDYPNVLNVTVKEALDIAKYMMPPTSGLSGQDVADIKAIYKEYLADDDKGSDSAYWNRSTNDNQAYWSKTGSS